MDRRQYLRLLGLTGGFAAAGCATPEPDGAETPTENDAPQETDTPLTPDNSVPHANRFETVIDLAEAGADTDGAEPVTELVEKTLDDDTLVHLPPGRYRIDNTVREKSFANLGIVGRHATIVPSDGFESVFFDLGRPGEASGLLVEGLTFDFRAPGAGSRPLSTLVDDDLVIRDVTVTGRQDAGQGMLRTDVTDPGGTGTIEAFRAPDGAALETDANGILVGSNHRGTLRVSDCRVEGFPDNGLYADPEHGRVEVVGGYYADCNISCVRVGNDSLVRNVEVRCDSTPEGYSNMRGIRLTHGDGPTVENCDIEMQAVTGSDGGITLGKSLTSATVTDTHVRVNADNVNGVQIKPPDGVPSDQRIELENVDVTGSAARRSAIEVHYRDDCSFKRVTVKQSGQERDGIVLDNATGTLRDCWIDVTGTPLISRGEGVVNVFDSYPDELNARPDGQ
jgi:hypothetical protein